MHSVAVPLSKSKIVLLLLVTLAFMVGGYWMSYMNPSQIEFNKGFNRQLIVHGVGVLSMIFGGLGTFATVRKLLDSSPGLLLNSRGLTDNSSAFSAGFVPWSDITGFEVGHIQKERILYVLLRDPERYISTFGPLKRALLKASQNKTASPVAITSSSLAIEFNELVRLTEQHFTASRENGQKFHN